MTSALRKTKNWLTDFIWPPSCPGCGSLINTPHSLCSTCWKDISFIDAPFCTCCGLPLPYDDALSGKKILCGTCSQKKTYFSKARSLLVYKKLGRQFVLNLKNTPSSPSFPLLAKWLINTANQLLNDSRPEDIYIAPVPLHWTRLIKRGFNQSAKLAQAIHKTYPSSILALDLLIRNQRTPSQGHLNRSDRIKNVANAFSINPKFTSTLRGKKILIVDDVMTTGATVDACAKTLKKVHPKEIFVLTIARVL